jgi:hypothetical protein
MAADIFADYMAVVVAVVVDSGIAVAGRSKVVVAVVVVVAAVAQGGSAVAVAWTLKVIYKNHLAAELAVNDDAVHVVPRCCHLLRNIP